jgi:serine/threonine protein kinase
VTCTHNATVEPCPACLLSIALEPTEAGTILNGRYRIVDLAGRGGMGEVYRAEDFKLGQQVALKFVRFANDDLRQRLLTEVRLGREVAHPNVCRIYDVVDLENEDCIVMEYVDGVELASLLPVTHDRALHIAREICAGVAALHARGVIHGDLKPGNVMIDSEGHVRITDFGLSKSVVRGLQPATHVAGTPKYMAPEQLQGQLSTRSDLYAMGVILRDLFGTAPPKTLVPMIERCLAPDPRHRPESAREILAVLPADDTSVFEDAHANEWRSPWLLAIAVVIALGIVTVVKPRVSIERDAFLSSDALEKQAQSLAPATDIDHASWFDGPPLVFRYKSSAQPMVSRDPDARITSSEPPMNGTMTLVALTPMGTLATDEGQDREPLIAYKLYLLLLIPLLGAAALMVRANLRSGRVDTKGARRLAVWAGICRMLYALLEAHHIPLLADEAQILGTGLSRSVLLAIEVWLGYLAVEPYIRRRRRGAIESWTRFLHGRFGDAIVGRDALIGLLFGTGMTLVACGDRFFGAQPLSGTLRMLSSWRSTFSHFFYFQTRAIFYALFAAVLLVALRSFIKPKWLGSAVWLVIATFVFTQSAVTPLHVVANALIAALLLIAIARTGMLSAAMALFAYLLLLSAPVTPFPAQWYAARGGVILILLMAIIAWATAVAARRRTAL